MHLFLILFLLFISHGFTSSIAICVLLSHLNSGTGSPSRSSCGSTGSMSMQSTPTTSMEVLAGESAAGSVPMRQRSSKSASNVSSTSVKKKSNLQRSSSDRLSAKEVSGSPQAPAEGAKEVKQSHGIFRRKDKDKTKEKQKKMNRKSHHEDYRKSLSPGDMSSKASGRKSGFGGLLRRSESGRPVSSAQLSLPKPDNSFSNGAPSEGSEAE